MQGSMTFNPAPWTLPFAGSHSQTSTATPKAIQAKKANSLDNSIATILGVSNRIEDSLSLREMTDSMLMQEVAKGDSKALEELYERHVRGCFGLAVKIVRDPSVAEEVVQDVFTKLWTNPSIFAPERGRFSSWLLTLVHNRSVDKLRRAKAGANISVMPLEADNESGTSLADMLADTAPGPEDEVWTEEKGRIVREVLQQLPEPQRQALTLAYFSGLTQREIADRLQEPLGTIKTRTRAALHQLRKLLTAQGLAGDLR
jgi:RNA polymerase sigma-70 factor (ECF subfamily)